MRKKKTANTLNEDEKSLFRDAMKGVRKMDAVDRIEHPTKRQKPPRISNTDFEQSLPLRDIFEPVENEATLFFQRDGVQANQIKQLKRGQIPVAAEIDLHGMTKVQAAQELGDFLRHCFNEGLRAVRIIHGKGYRSADGTGILKSAVNQWLRDDSGVLAFCSAPPRDGGTGAVNVLLRRKIEY